MVNSSPVLDPSELTGMRVLAVRYKDKRELPNQIEEVWFGGHFGRKFSLRAGKDDHLFITEVTHDREEPT